MDDERSELDVVHVERLEAGALDQRIHTHDDEGVLDWTGTRLVVDRADARRVVRLFDAIGMLQDDVTVAVNGIVARIGDFDVPEEEVFEHGVEVWDNGNATFFAMADDKEGGIRVEAVFTRDEIRAMVDGPALDPDGPTTASAPAP